MTDKEKDITIDSSVLNAQNTITGNLTNEDGTVKDNYAARDADGVINNKEFSTTPNTSTSANKSNSGSGLDAATDLFDYKWDTHAQERADIDYKKSVLEAKKNYLTNRQEIETQGQQMQEQVIMQEYSQNQSTEKAGWTGGYVLDTERQMAFLKQTIQAQMYGQIELQRYGYDTALAAARLAYDTNKYDLAMQYYQKAIENSLNEATVTGYYVSPEVKEHLNQYSIASKRLNEGTGTDRDKQIIESVYNWFESNGISKQGVMTMAKEDFITTLHKTAQSLANFQSDSSIFKIDIDSYGKIDANGELVYSEDNNTVETINFNEMSSADIAAYAKVHTTTKQQVIGYFENLINKDVQAYLDAVEKKDGDKTTYDISEEGFKKFIAKNSLITIADIYNKDTSLFNDLTITAPLKNKNVYIKINNGKVTLTIDYQTSVSTTTNTDNSSEENTNSNVMDTENLFNTPTNNENVNIDTGTDPYDTVIIDGLVAKIDNANKTATTDIKIMELDPSTQQYTKLISYNLNNIDKVREYLTSQGYHFGTKDTIDVSQDVSKWGDTIEQWDFDSDSQKGKAKDYVFKIVEDAKNKKIPLGAVVEFNYGATGGGLDRFVYLGGTTFARGWKGMGGITYIPDGYKENSDGKIKKK